MLRNPLRHAASLLGALAVLAAAGPVASAAASETSQITTPSTSTYVLNDESASPSKLKIEGTTNISGKARCAATSAQERRAKAMRRWPKK